MHKPDSSVKWNSNTNLRHHHFVVSVVIQDTLHICDSHAFGRKLEPDILLVLIADICMLRK